MISRELSTHSKKATKVFSKPYVRSFLADISVNSREQIHGSKEMVSDTIFDRQLSMARKKKKWIRFIKFGPKYGPVKRNNKQRPICKKGPDASILTSLCNKPSANSCSFFSEGRTIKGRPKETRDVYHGEQSLESDIVRCNNRILENFTDGRGRLWREITNLGVVSLEPQSMLKRRIRDVVCSNRKGKKGINRASK